MCVYVCACACVCVVCAPCAEVSVCTISKSSWVMRVSNVISMSCSWYRLWQVEGSYPRPQMAPVYCRLSSSVLWIGSKSLYSHFLSTRSYLPSSSWPHHLHQLPFLPPPPFPPLSSITLPYSPLSSFLLPHYTPHLNSGCEQKTDKVG